MNSNKLDVKLKINYEFSIDANGVIEIKSPIMEQEIENKYFNLISVQTSNNAKFRLIPLNTIATITLGIFNSLYLTQYISEDLINPNRGLMDSSKRKKDRADKYHSMLQYCFIYLAVEIGYTRKEIGEFLYKSAGNITSAYNKFYKTSKKDSNFHTIELVLNSIAKELKLKLNLYTD